MQTFGSEVAHLFEHIDKEVKDNPVYQQYESEANKWRDWPQEKYGQWSLPTNYHDAKSLAYDLYKSIAREGADGYNFPSQLTSSRHGDINDSIRRFNQQFLGYFTKALEEILNANPEFEQDEIKKVVGNTVFIIHGHDNSLKVEVQLLLTRAGVSNIVLHEQPDKGRTIIDKLIQETEKSNFAIALLSEDDKLQNGNNQARQNVILEIGYLMGKLGKERVRLIKKGDVNIPSDLQGVLYEVHDLSGGWKLKLAKELIAAGIYVDIPSITATF